MTAPIYKVVVYVEGKTEQIALPAFLSPLVAAKLQKGIAIEFVPKDSKERLLAQAPQEAALSLCNDPHLIAIAMPDLQPKNVGFPHETVDTLADVLTERFRNAVDKVSKRKAIDSADVKARFAAFCFKYNLEVLLLAAHEQLAIYLGLSTPLPTWSAPVEDLNHDKPPSTIVSELFRDHLHRKYNKVEDARKILEAASSDYKVVTDRCPQQFKPFVTFLEGV